MHKLKSNIGWLIDKSPYNRTDLRYRYNKSAVTISNWCTGKSYPSAIELFDLALLLNCTVDDLYERLEEEDVD
ncbi:helix-turn-helix domain-containing protein [Metabacillus halosaccharovorans]|uniref:Helix-turn-helix domain-containing protein n=1 Tax=Metabacillus halosaccharovorans TaxID=930124 RepID=A0ABT3DH28_9BACI|nr:helix-turn-helix transcriptional regulator [Metabacillus halosaccharovorans]MCV9886224.1 helix-turn-helix domain-containing protein [Metabacillus halosaccharovorans]